jgi:FkbM family methyltransferase
MTIKRQLLLLAERLTKTRVIRVSELPRGADLALDIARAFPRYRMEVIFDVGANVGQSAQHYLQWFPGAFIYCFEPVSESFLVLEQNLKGQDRVRCVNLALGSSSGRAEMALEGLSPMFQVRAKPNEVSPESEVRIESVSLDTIDHFCKEGEIDRISYLKVDTEGWDLEVLRGSSRMLERQAIDLVEVEAGMNPGNTRHVPFERLKDFLQSSGYLLFGIYQQVHEWPTKKPHLRRTNPLFVSRRMIEAH